MSYHSKTLGARARNYWGVVSQLLNQTIHFGGSPYPLTFSEMCHLKRHARGYRTARVVIDTVFSWFGEDGHCALTFRNGTASAIHRQRMSRDLLADEAVNKEGYL